MTLAEDWAKEKKRVRWMNTAFGLGRMVAEWEGYDGVRRKVEALTTLDLLAKVRAAIDESEREPPEAAPPLNKWPEPNDPSLKFGSPETEAQARARREEFLKMAQSVNIHPKPKTKAPEPTKPKPPANPYRRKFG